MLVQIGEKEYLDSADIRYIKPDRGRLHEDGFTSHSWYDSVVAQDIHQHGPHREVEITRITLRDGNYYICFMPVNNFIELLRETGVQVQSASKSSFY